VALQVDALSLLIAQEEKAGYGHGGWLALPWKAVESMHLFLVSMASGIKAYKILGSADIMSYN